jgi:predicted ATPase
VPDNLQRDIAMYRYNKIVFIAPPWEEIYTHDEERKQGWDEAVATYQNIARAYVDAGYEAIELPKFTVEERVEFVLSCISK